MDYIERELPHPDTLKPDEASERQDTSFSPDHRLRTSIWSILAIVFAVIFPIAGLVFGLIALHKIRHNPNLEGRWLAISAILISLAYIMVMVYLTMTGSFAFLKIGDSQIFQDLW